MSDAIMSTYSRLPVTFSHGEGAMLWDEQGKQYIDAISGIAVCSLGHARPEIAQALCDQASRLIHTSNLYQIDLQQKLADKLTALSGLDEVFFGNSGAEANEAAIKIARRYGSQKDIAQPAIMVVEGSFHGRTLATLSATGNKKIQQGFAPLVEGFIRVPYDDLDAVKEVAQNNSQVVAILVEPIQGEGGVNIPAAGYLQGLRDICDEHDMLLILDEIQTGIGRTGKWFAFQHSAILPDVMTLAKALGNGVPIGACLARGKAKGVLTPGTHGSTFGGNPLSCRAALAVLEVIESHNLCEQAAQLGHYFLDKFTAGLKDQPGITEIRGKGLMIGLELEKGCAELVAKALNNGVLINVTADKVIRLLPPLVTTREQADKVITAVLELVREHMDGYEYE